MVKQSRVCRPVTSSLAAGAAVLKADSTKKVWGSGWKAAGRVSGVFTVGLLAAMAAPREAKAIGFFTSNTATAIPAPQQCLDSIPTGSTSYYPGCYTSWLTTADLEGDGDMDIITANGGGYYTPGQAAFSVVYQNNGKGVFTDITPTVFNNAHNRLRQVSVADVDGDGDFDIYQPGGFGFDLDKLWIQTAPGVFEDRAAMLLPDGLMSRAASCHMGDLDDDGDADLVVMDWGLGISGTTSRALLYTNDGTGKFTLAAAQKDQPSWLPTDRLPATIPGTGSGPTPGPVSIGALINWGTRSIDVDFADIDNDFDLDIVVDMRNGYSRLFLNDGHANFTDGTGWAAVPTADGKQVTLVTNYPAKTPGSSQYVYNQELCDLDDDGDLDLLLDNVGPRIPGNPAWGYANTGQVNTSQILINNGKGKFIDDTVNRVSGEPGGDDNALKCADLNNDNHYDVIVATLSGRSEKLLINDGFGHLNFIPDGIPYGFSTGTNGDSSLSHDLTDFNGDKMLDMVTGQGETGQDWSEKIYYGAGGSVPDSRPPLVRAYERPSPLPETPTVVRYALRDNVTNEQGQMIKATSVTYSLAGGAEKTVPGKYFGGDLFRATIPAQVAGSVVTVKINATDRAGNVGTAIAAYSYTVPTPVPPPVVETGGSGSGGGSATAGSGGTGGATAGTGGATAGSAGEAGASEAGSGGEAGEVSVAGGSSVGGSSTGTGGKASGGKAGSPTGEAGEPNTGTGGKGHYETVEEGGCSVSTSTPATKGRGAALLGFGLAMLGLVRRRRNSKQ